MEKLSTTLNSSCYHIVFPFATCIWQLVGSESSSSHKQPRLAAFRLVSNDQREYYFQRQGRSNLCGLCALNNVCSQELFSAQELDNIADTLWLELFLEVVASELHPLRCRDGKLPSAFFFSIYAYRCWPKGSFVIIFKHTYIFDIAHHYRSRRHCTDQCSCIINIRPLKTPQWYH